MVTRGLQKLMVLALVLAMGASAGSVWAAKQDAKNAAPAKNDAKAADPKAAKPQKSTGGNNESDAVAPNPEAIRLAITDLMQTFGDKYPKGAEYLKKLEALKQSNDTAGLEALRREALLANPLLAFNDMLIIKHGLKSKKLGLPQNWQGNSSIGTHGYDREIGVLSTKGGYKTLYKPQKDEFVGDLELHFNADKFLFSKPGTNNKYQLFEMKTDGSGVRQVTPGDQPDVDNYSGTYLPDGRLIFCSTATYVGVPCVSGADHVGGLYLMDEKTKNIRQLTFDQDHSWYPHILNNGMVLYTRWEYSDTPHYFTRMLFQMNPDGTSQFELMGSNSYWPNTMIFARPIPNDPSKIVAVISGHHGVARMGELVVFDPAKSHLKDQGAVQKIPGYGKVVEPKIADQLVNNSWPKFLHPFPLSDKYFLVACQPRNGALWGIYLVDTFDNFVLLHEEQGYAMFEPIAIQKRTTPPIIPDRVNPNTKDATVYVVDIYRGPGLKDIPRGEVKSLRVYTQRFSYRGMGGHVHIGVDGPWDAKRMLGTVPVHEDGSALFTAPANMPLAVSPLDAEGRALQVMRSWYTAMPGEFAACVGCHERQMESPTLAVRSIASTKPPTPITPWYGPARPFSFDREVQQPVLQKYCVGCHNGSKRPDGRILPDFRGRDVHPKGGEKNFDVAYLALHPYVYRYGNEGDWRVLPAAYCANVSELIQMLKKGHHNVQLDKEAWERLYAWIDLNVPCHGTWNDHNGRAIKPAERLQELAKLYGGADVQHEVYPDMPKKTVTTIMPPPEKPVADQKVDCAGWPFDAAEAKKRQDAAGPSTRTLDLPNGQKLELVRIPAGEFVMGSLAGCNDERPLTKVKIDKPFWMAKTEISNEVYAAFDPLHDSGIINQHNKDHDTRGYPANLPKMPVIRVNWRHAMAFCNWLSVQTGEKFTLPTEAQWEYACRAGSATPFWYGDMSADFGKNANLADQAFRDMAVSGLPPRPIPKDKPNPLLDWLPRDNRFNDGSMQAAEVGKYQANPWGLQDMHGNVGEWTLSTYKPYPYNAADGRDNGQPDGEKVVRGGSWYDRPMRCTSSFRLSYPSWQGVFNVGFRVVSEGKGVGTPVVKASVVK